MVKYVKANTGADKDIVVTYRNKIIYDGTITAEPTDIFKGIKNFNPDENYEDKRLVRVLNDIENNGYLYSGVQIPYRNALVHICYKEDFDPSSIIPKERTDPNTAIIDGERYTAKEIADDVMLEADNYEDVYRAYQELLSNYAKKVVENGWEGTSRDRVPATAINYVITQYRYNHTTRKQDLGSMCEKFIRNYMQDDYDRYKSEFRGN